MTSLWGKWQGKSRCLLLRPLKLPTIIGWIPSLCQKKIHSCCIQLAGSQLQSQIVEAQFQIFRRWNHHSHKRTSTCVWWNHHKSTIFPFEIPPFSTIFQAKSHPFSRERCERLDDCLGFGHCLVSQLLEALHLALQGAFCRQRLENGLESSMKDGCRWIMYHLYSMNYPKMPDSAKFFS